MSRIRSTAGVGRHRRAALAAGSLLAAGALVGVAPQQHAARAATPPVRFVPGGHVAGVPAGSVDLGPAAAPTPVHLAVVLKPRDPAGLDAYAAASSSPGSPGYRHFLTTAQETARFGPTETTVARVEAALRAAGLTPAAVSANRLVVSVDTTAAHAAAALHAGRLESYRTKEGRVAYANTQAPSLAAVAGDVQAILGLNTLVVPTTKPPAAAPHRVSRATPASTGPQACTAAKNEASSSGGYTDTQLAKAYSISGLYAQGRLGAGSRVALFELDPFAKADIAAYQTCFKTAVPITDVPVDGGDHGDGTNAGEGEAALDIEVAIGLAPKAKLSVYEAPETNYAASTVDEYTKIVDDDTAQVVSSSYGLCEPLVDAVFPGLTAAEHTIFQQAASQGQSVFVATGDTGSEECYPNGGTLADRVGDEPIGIAVDPGNHTSFVANYGADTLSVVDDRFRAVVGTITLPSGVHPSAVAVDPTRGTVYVGEEATGKLLAFSDANCNAGKTSGCGKNLSTLALGGSAEPDGVAVNPTTGTVYVAGTGTNMIYVVRESNLTLAKAFASGGSEPYSIAVDETADRIWWGNLNSNTVRAVNGSACDAGAVGGCSPLGPVTVGDQPVSVLVDHADGKLFVSDYQDAAVSVVGLTSLAKTDDIQMSAFLEFPYGLTLTPNGHHVVVAGAVAGGAVQSATDVVVDGRNDGLDGLLGATSGNPTMLATDPSQGLVVETDAGADAVTFLPVQLAVGDPASQSNVTAVGGTDLTALGPKPTETTWNEYYNPGCDCEAGAGTGGISTNWTMPATQKAPGVVNSYSSGAPCGASSGNCREVPDVAASADPFNGYVIYHDGSWTSIGGTSAATPLWAAMFAVIEGGTRDGLVTPELYAIAKQGQAGFDDVKKGTIDYLGTNDGAYPATQGYDQATGLGTPVATALLAHFD